MCLKSECGLMKKKGQVSAEFLVMLSVVFLVLFFAFDFQITKFKEFDSFKESFESKNYSLELSYAINSVYLSGNGSLKELVFNSSKDFNLNAVNKTIFVEYGDFYADAKIIAPQIQINSYSFNGKNLIKNESGIIVIEAKDVNNEISVFVPNISLESPASNYASSFYAVQFDYIVNDSDSGIAFCELLINGLSVDSDFSITEGITQSFNYVFSENGVYGWDVNCTDNSIQANEQGSDLNRQIIITLADTFSPVVTLESPAAGYSSSSYSVQFDYSVNDADSEITSCELIINGASVDSDTSIAEEVTQSFNYLFSFNGIYSWDVNCTDTSIVLNEGSSYENRSITINQVIPNNVLGYWKLDEGTGSIAVDSGENQKDGRIYNAEWVEGISGSALSFNGTSSYVEISHDSLFNVKEMSFSAWANTNKHETTKVLQKGDWDGHGIYLDKWTGWKTAFRINGASYNINWTQGQPKKDNWYFLTATYDGKQIKLYVDGKLVNFLDVEGELNTNSRPVLIGSAGGQKYFSGILDELTIYDAVLTEAEVLALYEKHNH